MSLPVRSLDRDSATVLVFADAASASRAAGDRIAQSMREAVSARGHVTLGLSTGATPEGVYARLVALHRSGELSFDSATTFNLDEYYPMSPLDPRSYRSYMHERLFAHVDLPCNRAHVLDGTVPEAFVSEHAALYDRWIHAAGGIDVQLLGIGRNGHIGFNEPASVPLETALAWPSRLVELHPVTRASAAREFGSEARVPRCALTVGIAPILAARSILILAFGETKSEVVANALNGPISAHLPASLLQKVANRVTWILDEAAAGALVAHS
jgi:glucosamine-6-phosphate deaminase